MSKLNLKVEILIVGILFIEIVLTVSLLVEDMILFYLQIVIMEPQVM